MGRRTFLLAAALTLGVVIGGGAMYLALAYRSPTPTPAVPGNPPAGVRATPIATDLDLPKLVEVAVGPAEHSSSPRSEARVNPSGGLSTHYHSAIFRLPAADRGRAAAERLLAAAEKHIKDRGGDMWYRQVGRSGDDERKLWYYGLGYRLAGRRGYLHLWVTYHGDCLSAATFFYETDGDHEVVAAPLGG